MLVAIALAIWLVVCVVIAGLIAPKTPNTGFADAAGVLAFISLVAVAIERHALADPYFIERRLYPNVDFYSGLIYEAMGIPLDSHTLMFAVARMSGWVAQWLEMIADRDKYPEFDVPDFDSLAADEAYECELSPSGQVGRCRLTSAWRRTVASRDAQVAVGLVQTCDEYQKLVAASPSRPTYLGDLEAVSWTPPCESDHTRWTLDVWYLLAFDGRIGSGRSFLADLETKQIVSVRDFSVRTG